MLEVMKLRALESEFLLYFEKIVLSELIYQGMYCMHCWNALWNFNPTEMYLYPGFWALAEFLLGFSLTLVHLFFIWNHGWLSPHSFIFQFPGNHWAYLCFVNCIVNCCFKKNVQLPNACCWALMKRILYRKNNKCSYFSVVASTSWPFAIIQ